MASPYYFIRDVFRECLAREDKIRACTAVVIGTGFLLNRMRLYDLLLCNSAENNATGCIQRNRRAAFQNLCGMFRAGNDRLIQRKPDDRCMRVGAALLGDNTGCRLHQVEHPVGRLRDDQNIAGFKLGERCLFIVADAKVSASNVDVYKRQKPNEPERGNKT